ncbi:MAG TPA: thioredoxin [Papillibacter sp.]|jgi:thioredoxin 1|nr:thioredoxin [Papillibacter sp.]
MPVLTVSKENFEKDVLQSEKPVVVDFWAPWCGYCKRLMPVIDALAEDSADKLHVAKLDVDENEELEDRYEVMTIPTLILFQKGKAGEPLVNPGSRAEIDDWLRSQGIE